ncbi:MAG: HAMP domain-containing protein [Alphaproteobacteria bacterium]|nr:HAMP domain-containing protein [Alphaproteobacteria bacterium]
MAMPLPTASASRARALSGGDDPPGLSLPAPPRGRRGFPSITFRILALNLIALLILVGGLLYLDQFRANLIEAKVAALRTEGEIIAAALGEAAVAVDGDIGSLALDGIQTRVLLRRLIEPTQHRARVFAADQHVVADSRILQGAGREVQFDFLPPEEELTTAESIYEWVRANAGFLLPEGRPLPPYIEYFEQSADQYEEVTMALTGEFFWAHRDRTGTPVLIVALPIQSFKRVLGALMLMTDAVDIEQTVREVRLAILQVSGVALAITVLLSLYLAGTIARPVRRLAAAADRVRRTRGRQVPIPDFTARRDEIGALSGALREMTAAFYQRLDAIESFAADVAHEIRNPLTSLRSAVEAFDKAQDASQKERLVEIIRDDVTRIDRLLTDISAASRLDAELWRSQMATVDLGVLVKRFVDAKVDAARPEAPALRFDTPEPGPFVVVGIDERLGQVLRNLVNNAESFSPPGGRIVVTVRRAGDQVELVCEDDGPGIPPDDLDKVFERFYTRRPQEEAFGMHSGLGLSISQQIVTAHGGTIHAENRVDAEGRVAGARFVVRLPAADARRR